MSETSHHDGIEWTKKGIRSQWKTTAEVEGIFMLSLE
jgi:hypothetical protein